MLYVILLLNMHTNTSYAITKQYRSFDETHKTTNTFPILCIPAEVKNSHVTAHYKGMYQLGSIL